VVLLTQFGNNLTAEYVYKFVAVSVEEAGA
jgi:hypothetical protein